MAQRFLVHKSVFVGVSNTDQSTSYSLLANLGKGNFGAVYKVKQSISGSVFALKAVPKHKVSDVSRVLFEIDVLKQADHPQIVRIYNVFEDTENINIVMELCEGGELLKDYAALTENDAMRAMKQILSAVTYLHLRNICHRDLKPENVLFATKGDIESLKIIDFGLAKVTSPFRGMQTRTGSPYYVSPDVLRGNYGLKCDLWSAGVILYIMLSGSPPFYGRNQPELFSQIMKGQYSFPGELWERISGNAKDLIAKLLVIDPEQRLSAQEALEHPWFVDTIPNLSLCSVLPNIVHFYHCKNLQKAALLAVASFCSESEIHDLKQKFQALDVNHDGTITVSELAKGLENTPPDDVELIVQSLDQEGSGVVNYSEFIAATLDQAVLLQEGRLWDAFLSFDHARSGRITAAMLCELLTHYTPQAVDSEAISKLLQEADSDGDGSVNFYEFVDLVRRQNSGDTLPSGQLR